MSRKFVRNITGTKARGTNKEPFTYNVQNDLLSDESEVYVRQTQSEVIEDKYHCITDDVKEIITENPMLIIENFEHDVSPQSKKNKSTVTVNKATKEQAEKGEEPNSVMSPLTTKKAIDKFSPPVNIKSSNLNQLTITRNGLNDFTLNPNFSGNGGGVSKETVVKSGDVNTLDVSKTAPYEYTVTPKLNDYATKEDLEKIETGDKNVPTVITSGTPDTLDVKKNSENNFIISNNLTDYATKEDIEGLPTGEIIPTEIVSSTPTTLKVEKVSENNFKVGNDLSGYATKEELEAITPTPSIPVKIDSKTPTIIKVIENSPNNFTINGDLKTAETIVKYEIIPFKNFLGESYKATIPTILNNSVYVVSDNISTAVRKRIINLNERTQVDNKPTYKSFKVEYLKPKNNGKQTPLIFEAQKEGYNIIYDESIILSEVEGLEGNYILLEPNKNYIFDITYSSFIKIRTFFVKINSVYDLTDTPTTIPVLSESEE